jgi:sugar lactone lactonase YvrE
MSPLNPNAKGVGPDIGRGSNPDTTLYFGFLNARAGILINDVAIDPDTGDAYFTDSPNCRENIIDDADYYYYYYYYVNDASCQASSKSTART